MVMNTRMLYSFQIGWCPIKGTLLTEKHSVVLRVGPPPLFGGEAHDFPG